MPHNAMYHPLAAKKARHPFDALRERYHAAACSGFNYARSAEDSLDPCLTKLFEELSKQSYAHAETLMGLLQRSLQRT